VESSLWKRLWTCRKTDYYMNELKATMTAGDPHLLTLSVFRGWLMSYMASDLRNRKASGNFK